MSIESRVSDVHNPFCKPQQRDARMTVDWMRGQPARYIGKREGGLPKYRVDHIVNTMLKRLNFTTARRRNQDDVMEVVSRLKLLCGED